jgi:microcystin-dependent protein
MGSPYVGEIRMFAGNFAPAGWMFCEGQLLAISEYEILFNLIGTTYGGDGQTTFALPDLRGRLPVHQGNGFTLAETGGTETVTLSTAQMPQHTHAAQATNDLANSAAAANGVLSQSTTATAFVQLTTNQALSPASIASAGGTQPHDNFQPYLCVSFILSLFGVYPSQT